MSALVALAAALGMFGVSYGSALIVERITGRQDTAGGVFIAAQIVLTTVAILAV